MAGPSRRHVEGEEVDADVSHVRQVGITAKLTLQWLKLIKTHHDVHVQVGDKVPLGGLPYESNLLAVSNVNDVLVVGGAQGQSFAMVSHRLG